MLSPVRPARRLIAFDKFRRFPYRTASAGPKGPVLHFDVSRGPGPQSVRGRACQVPGREPEEGAFPSGRM